MASLPQKPIVAGIDGSAQSLNAAMWAAGEAHMRHAPLRLVNASDVSSTYYAEGMYPSASYFEELVQEGTRYLDVARKAVTDAYPSLSVATEVLRMNPRRAIIEESEGARMLVVGSHGRGPLTSMLIGSITFVAATHAQCPVAIIREPLTPALTARQSPVVVGVDGSPASEVAVSEAFEEASLRNVDLVAVHCWTDFVSDSGYARASLAVVDWRSMENEQAEILAERLAGWREKYPDVSVRRVIEREAPAHNLLKHAQDAQLLVVGSRGRGGFAGLVLGSTSRALVHHATGPLLIARPHPEQ